MISSKDIPEPSQSYITKLVRDGKTHQHYGVVTRRARVMKAWYEAEEDADFTAKSEIIKRSPIESTADYNNRLENFNLLPFELKFIQTQQRIYDENNVQRTYPESSKEFWHNKEAHFDDFGDEIDVFFRDKVLFTKEVEGFGAICLDLAMNGDKTVSVDGKAVPYPYIIQAQELKYYETWHGHLKLLITCQKRNGKDEWRAFTPENIYVFEDQKAQPKKIPHKFGRTPAIILKGAPDSRSGFKIGKPRRWSLKGLYLAISELFYDLKGGSKLFAHPIPAMPFSMIKQIAGAYSEDDGFQAEKIKDELGMVIPYPDDNPPNKLFYQADMQGLQHLDNVIFNNLVNIIYQLAQVRDKSKVVHNSSGRSKQFDSVEEQGLLAQTATDMQAIEQDTFDLMGVVRGEKDFKIIYSKHHDLSSADEIWTQFTEGQQYGGVPVSVKSYQVKEYLRKKSAPQEVQDALKDEIETNGFPMSSEELSALKDKIDDTILILKTRPELANDKVTEKLKQELSKSKELLLTTTNQQE